jgi:hypothetical protein
LAFLEYLESSDDDAMLGSQPRGGYRCLPGERRAGWKLGLCGYICGLVVGCTSTFVARDLLFGVDSSCEPYFPRVVYTRDVLWAWWYSRENEATFETMDAAAAVVSEQVMHEAMETASSLAADGVRLTGGSAVAYLVAWGGSYVRRLVTRRNQPSV